MQVSMPHPLPHGMDAPREVGVVDSHHMMGSDQPIGRNSSMGDSSAAHQLPAGSNAMLSDNCLPQTPSGDQEVAHRSLTGRDVASSSSGKMAADAFGNEQPLVRNDTLDKQLSQDMGTAADINLLPTSADSVCNSSLKTAEMKTYNQDGAPFPQEYNKGLNKEASQALASNTELPEDARPKALPVKAPPPKEPIHSAPPIKQPPQPFVGQPMAVNALKRCTYETYSSDDDDVFLPNPPSKSQADKCIVSMDTSEDTNLPKIVTTAPSAEEALPDEDRAIVTEVPKDEEEEKMEQGVEEDERQEMAKEEEKMEVKGDNGEEEGSEGAKEDALDGRKEDNDQSKSEYEICMKCV